MLEVRNLTKIYKTKGGADVHALDGVTLTFPETGMVFLLGKSGSGKSTLLNVCGGLDSPSGGEIVVKGRSSANFSQSDFDSYRNTFIGFIFQEYNILNEFSVEDNIALALELQGKPKDKAAISELLEEVDLVGYAKRKPNTLSGGQKQRIAIARALVKNPEIIMADEPTGALDSTTGKQVFETLKKLSEKKLVIVVSHDREFAEQYGDRIIELKDGKILSDVSKTTEERQAISENVVAVGDTLCIKNGEALTDEDFENVKAFLKKSQGDVIVSGGEKDVKTFKKVSRITDDGEKEVFRDTKADETVTKTYTPEESRFIRSKLPLRHAFKIGASGLKTKPIRLIFTILLCTIAFALFSVASTMTFYDRDKTMKQSLMDSSYDSLIVKKEYVTKVNYYYEGKKQNSYKENRETRLSKAEVDELKDKFGENVIALLAFGEEYMNKAENVDSNYYDPRISYVTVLPETHERRNGIQGAYPANKDEIALSSYTAQSILQFGLKDPETGEAYPLKENSALTALNGLKIQFNNGKIFTISGIYETEPLDSKYDGLKQGTSSWKLIEQLQNDLETGLYRLAYVHADYETEILSDGGKGVEYELSDYFAHSKVLYAQFNDDYESEWYYQSFSATVKPPYKMINGKTALADDEILLSPISMMQAIDTSEALKSNPEASEKYYNADEKGDSVSDLLNQRLWSSHQYTQTEINAAMDKVIDFLQTYAPNLTVRVTANFEDQTVDKTLKVVGVFPFGGWSTAYVSQAVHDEFYEITQKIGHSYEEYITKYVVPEDAIYTAVCLPFNRSSAQASAIVKMTKTQADDGVFTLDNPIAQGIKMADNLVKNMSTVFLVLGIVLAVFSALLLSNFISVSISHKKREIGILRAVGARSFDVFKIFFSESFVITVICIVLSLAGGAGICAALNGEVASMLGGVSVFVFGFLPILILTALAFFTAFAATILPVWLAARKKPVESIRAL